MKKALFLPLLFLSLITRAQDIMVESFRQLDTDLTANTTGTIELDQNGEKCALIKVSTSQTDFTFDAGMLGVVKTIQKTGEIWLYVPAGVKRLTISHVGMETLRDHDLGMSVQKAQTYLLTLKTTKDVTLQTVTFKVSPANAMVMIESDDPSFAKQSLTLQNGTASTNLPTGNYTYTAILSGYYPDESPFIVSNSPKVVSVELVPMPGTTPAQPTPTIAAVPTTPAVVSPEKSPSNLTFTVNGVSFTMIYVEGGTFTMGLTPEQGKNDIYVSAKPAHDVTLSSYHIGETEVTQELWEAVMDSNPSKFKGSHNPVESVSWNDCQEFISRLNKLTGKKFRLPTEAEWEYAARGGNKSRGYKYSGGNEIDAVAWYGVLNGSTHSVSTKSPNELGIYDMSGNVMECCSDWYGKYLSELTKNPTGASSGKSRVLRGGCYCSGASSCRVSGRDSRGSSYRNDYLGLRLGL